MPKVPKTAVKRPNLTEYQRNIIRFCHSNGKTVDEIRSLKELARLDGSKPQKRTVTQWIARLTGTGDVQPKKMTGRARKLNRVNEAKVVEYIDRNPKVDYSRVAARFTKKFKFDCDRRMINQYALRNGISK